MDLSSIIDAASDTSSSLEDGLLKAKVVLRRLQQNEIAEWVDLELNGYGDEDVVPSYRHVKAHVVGMVSNGLTTAQNMNIPMMGVKENFREAFERLRMPNSVSGLERLASEDKDGISKPIPSEANSILSVGLAEGYSVMQASSSIGVGQVHEILTRIRSHLIDLIIDIESVVADASSTRDAREALAKTDISSVFQNNVFGDGATVLVGHGGTVLNVSSIIAGDISSLRLELAKHGVKEESLEELELAIKHDEKHDRESGIFGPKVGAWMGTMLNKAADTTWQIELGVASSLIATAIGKYYGI